jgi:hypothetical protein
MWKNHWVYLQAFLSMYSPLQNKYPVPLKRRDNSDTYSEEEHTLTEMNT